MGADDSTFALDIVRVEVRVEAVEKMEAAFAVGFSVFNFLSY